MQFLCLSFLKSDASAFELVDTKFREVPVVVEIFGLRIVESKAQTQSVDNAPDGYMQG